MFDAAVKKAYGGKRKIKWLEVFAGETAFQKFNNWLPDETVKAFQDYLVGNQGAAMTTPAVGKGIRSLNVALRQMLDLYVCLRPVRWFKGVPSPVKHPEKVNMTIFREKHSEDIYAVGIEGMPAARPKPRRCSIFWRKNFPRISKRSVSGRRKRRSSGSETASGPHGAPCSPGRLVEVGIGFKPVSYLGTMRLIHAAILYAVANKSKSVTIVPQGQLS